MSKRPTPDFWNAAHNAKPEPDLADPLDLNPPRDKDNDALNIPPPIFAPGSASNLAPPGSVGTRLIIEGEIAPSPAPDRAVNAPSSQQLDDFSDLVTDGWQTQGTLTTYQGYSFDVTMETERHPDHLDGGRISSLQIQKDHDFVALFEKGWIHPPTIDEEWEVVRTVKDTLDPPAQDFKPIVPRDQDHDPEIGR